ncbi:TetR/AcrR family transcriptional regulator [Actinophytocola oryzae]|uniref:TetR family transcriptional regulator n=1 Tax=Actinophytocola oryzae TaxID=502181 RepID=A0A4R7VI16_9PSEU|nr:TetR/AcrR family transcriptional regulator [Actinophytocola oryzae]TDV48728.1 TetR family transcriptional regulator [Actinophytocola oryzae]
MSAATPDPPRRVRADAQRNIDALVDAAREVFGASGVDAPVREITTRAGVGLATFYRHFPDRADLVSAVYRNEVDSCAAAAATLAATHEPVDALVRWLRRFTAFVGVKRGLATALHSGNPAFEPLPAYFRQNFEPALGSLLTAAAATGEIRGDVAPGELLSAVSRLCAAGDTTVNERMVALLVDGLRYGAKPGSRVRG